MEILKNGSCLLIRSRFSAAEDVVLKVEPGKSNAQINFRETRLIPAGIPLDATAFQSGQLIHACPDDATPWLLNGTYIGANHGCSDVCAVTCPAHGLTEADIGSAWQDEGGTTFHVIKIADADTCWLLSANKSTNVIWRFIGTLKGHALTRNDAAGQLTVQRTARAQLTPACRIARQTYLVDGQTELPEGQPVRCRFLEVREEYDIISPAAVLNDIIAHPGQPRDFTAAHLDAVVRNRITYRFHAYGCTVVEHHCTALQDFNLGYMGFIQSSHLNRAAFPRHGYYIPKTKPFEQDGLHYDFQAIQDYSSNPTSPLLFKSDTDNLADPQNLPDRFIQLLGTATEEQADWSVGYAFGYSLVSGLGRPAERARNTSQALMLYKSGKSYPSAVNSQMGNPITAGTEFKCTAYRCYFNAAAHQPATACYWYPAGKGWIVYADYHAAVENTRLELPPFMAGHNLAVIEQSESVTIHSGTTVPSQGLLLSVTGSHGYLVMAVR